MYSQIYYIEIQVNPSPADILIKFLPIYRRKWGLMSVNTLKSALDKGLMQGVFYPLLLRSMLKCPFCNA